MQQLSDSQHTAKWLVISSDELESLQATIEILSDPEWKKEVLAGHADALAGRTTPLEAVKKQLGD